MEIDQAVKKYIISSNTNNDNDTHNISKNNTRKNSSCIDGNLHRSKLRNFENNNVCGDQNNYKHLFQISTMVHMRQ